MLPHGRGGRAYTARPRVGTLKKLGCCLLPTGRLRRDSAVVIGESVPSEENASVEQVTSHRVEQVGQRHCVAENKTLQSR